MVFVTIELLKDSKALLIPIYINVVSRSKKGLILYRVYGLNLAQCVGTGYIESWILSSSP